MPGDDFFGTFGDPFGPETPVEAEGENDFRWKWVQDGREFRFPYPWDLEKWDDAGATYAAPESESPGISNTYQEDSYLRPRDITLTGRVVADNPTLLRQAFDILASVFPEGSAGKMYRSSGRYVNARVGLFRESEADEGFNDRPWTLGLRCADPFYYDATPQEPVSLIVTGTGGTTGLTPGGTAIALPLITLVVPAGGVNKMITLTSPGNAEICAFTPPAAGTYLLDSTEGTITKGGVDYLWAIDGDLLSLRHYPTAITVLLSEAGILTSANVQWVRRWRSG